MSYQANPPYSEVPLFSSLVNKLVHTIAVAAKLIHTITVTNSSLSSPLSSSSIDVSVSISIAPGVGPKLHTKQVLHVVVPPLPCRGRHSALKRCVWRRSGTWKGRRRALSLSGLIGTSQVSRVWCVRGSRRARRAARVSSRPPRSPR